MPTSVPGSPETTSHPQRGFTLLELLVVMVIIGLLASIIAPQYFSQIGKSNVKVARAQVEALGQALVASLGDAHVALMRGHGSVTVGTSIQQVVFRGIYTESSARLQASPETMTDRRPECMTQLTPNSRVLGLNPPLHRFSPSVLPPSR